MANKRAKTRAERQAKTPVTLPDRFIPRFWDEADKRQAAVKEIRRRYELLKEDAAADSVQKDLLVQRAIFISVQLETMEINATETGEFNAGVYTQMVNALSGLLSKLGLERKAKTVLNLKSYVEGT